MSIFGEILRFSAREVVELIRKREISPGEVALLSLERTKSVNQKINCIPTVCFERAVHTARHLNEIDVSVPLFGIPICVKDLTAVAGVRTTLGTRALRDYVPSESDPIVERLEKNGAIVIGKSNTPEMGAGNFTINEVFGVTKNPWDLERSPGGSSGGSAAAVSSGAVWLAHGTDLAGSLRNPASFCGVVALRPSPGRAGGAPPSILFNQETVHGPIARDVLDCALMLDAMVGYTRRSPISIERPGYSYFNEVSQSLSENYRIAYSSSFSGYADIEKDIIEIIDNVMRAIALHVYVDEYNDAIPELDATYKTLRLLVWGAGPGTQPNSVQKLYGPVVKHNIEKARKLTSDEICRAMANRSKIFNQMLTLFEEYDCLACPVIGHRPGLTSEIFPQIIDGHKVDEYEDALRFSFLAPAAGLPAIAIPIGRDVMGLPVGLQLIGPPRSELGILKVAYRIEEIVGMPFELKLLS